MQIRLMKEISLLPKNLKLFMLAILMTNIGNGMHTIAVSKLLYDKTHSAMSFGGVILIEYVVSFFIQFVSGSLVDRNNPKRISIICDVVRGIQVLSIGILLGFTGTSVYYLFITLLIVNMVTPFYRSAIFSLIPALSKESSSLLSVNSMIYTLFQAGQLLGVALVAPIVFLLNPSIALIIDGTTFLLSAALVAFIKITKLEIKTDNTKNIKSLISDWKEVLNVMKTEKSFTGHVLVSSADYVCVSLVNLMLVPMVTIWYSNNSYLISVFDGGFAIGAMLSVLFTVALSKRIGSLNCSWVGLICQGILFILIMVNRFPLITFILMVGIGAFNAFSISIFQTSLQERCNGPIKGRVSALRQFIVSCFSVVLIPIISYFHDISLALGMTISGVIVIVFGVASFLLGRSYMFGENYLSKPIFSNNNITS
ncbi:major facilitator superfamily protein [Ruminiclostridium hungatei]|uniref:Major facilitator superfamily protein n=1 Tax=Ruminiclostridium hungatei TaxID=48256 RepID=A0A1V4SJ49_RUMHU|nr:MFS transporter [Ruminiclostridium hungatei]OPX43922.1 major facilitator superfamily protein [Ruminiclostridium hungatei]